MVPLSDREIMISVLARVVNIDNAVTDIKRQMEDKADKESVSGLHRRLDELDRDNEAAHKTMEKDHQQTKYKIYWFSGAAAGVAALIEILFGIKK